MSQAVPYAISKFLAVAAMAVACSRHVNAEIFTYLCQSKDQPSILKIDDSRKILSWKSKTYHIRVQGHCAKYGWRAERLGEAFDFCTATRGYADFEEKGSTVRCDQSTLAQPSFTPDMKLSKSDNYAGCLFSIAIPLMHNGVVLDKARSVAFDRCGRQGEGLPQDEAEGISDYFNLVLETIEHK